MAGDDGAGRSMGEGMICDYEGSILAEGGETPNKVVTGEIVPSKADEARENWGVENNPYQLGHRGFVAVEGGANDAPYTYMHDLVAGEYRLPWEDRVKVKDGAGMGFPPPRKKAGEEAVAGSSRGG